MSATVKLSASAVPHQTTYERALSGLDELDVERVLGLYLSSQQPENITIRIDGKVLRATIPIGETQGTRKICNKCFGCNGVFSTKQQPK